MTELLEETGVREALADLESAEALERLERADQVPPRIPPEAAPGVLERDERRGRADLRRQVARMEAELGALFGDALRRPGIDWRVANPVAAGPRLLDLEELERTRDALAARLQRVRGLLHDRALVEEQNRRRLEELIADPAGHRWQRIANEDIGEPGCRHWWSVPRWGPIGMLVGWWRVKVSSGCPLARGRGVAAPRPKWHRSL